jgi:hypothetical protein
VEQRFAICVVFPGTNTVAIVNAVMKHDVQVIGKEYFDPSVVYARMMAECKADGADISLLFVFPNRDAVLVNDKDELVPALNQCVRA